MSEIIVDTIESDNGSLSFGNTAISGGIIIPGSVVNFAYLEEDRRLSNSASNNAWTVFGAMEIEIVRTVADSKFHIVYMLNGECTGHDHMFTIHRRVDGGSWSLIGYNTDVGQQRWSGVSHGWYDRDNNSTQYNSSAVWYDENLTNAAAPVGSTVSYTIGTRSSNTANYTYWMNRTDSRGGQNAYENTVSVGYVMEIAP